MKEKLKKHKLSILFAFVWSVAGALLLTYAAFSWFPFLDSPGKIEKSIPLLAGAAFGYLVIASILAKLRAHPYTIKPLVVNFVASVTTIVLFVILAAVRVYFSLSFLLLYFLFTNLWFSMEFFMRANLALYLFAVVPGGIALVDGSYQNVQLKHLEGPDDLPQGVDGVIVDFHRSLSEEWLSFVSRCVLEGIPVVSTDDFVETQRGTIILEHLTTAQSITFQTTSIYLVVKRLLDIILVLVSIPIWLPIMIVTCILVSLESPSMVIFSQKRVGRRGNPFTIYKIRSMRFDSEKNGAAFAAEVDARVTRIGAVIRKFRIDEIPQFWNVLRGDMSLIGPRPEQVPFVASFEKTIPYYQLRHIVRPGISGWAQVTMGYAAGKTETAEKLALDLYYVKRVSFVLDFLIFIKTLGTMLTGFGAR
jgi:lipopolysaccharide/colanic/teichoic acid biosynthesis glycosyltransferase